MNKEEKKELIKTLSEMLNLMRGHQYNQEIFGKVERNSERQVSQIQLFF